MPCAVSSSGPDGWPLTGPWVRVPTGSSAASGPVLNQPASSEQRGHRTPRGTATATASRTASREPPTRGRLACLFLRADSSVERALTLAAWRSSWGRPSSTAERLGGDDARQALHGSRDARTVSGPILGRQESSLTPKHRGRRRAPGVEPASTVRRPGGRRTYGRCLTPHRAGHHQAIQDGDGPLST
jgi:hypothetical protein